MWTLLTILTFLLCSVVVKLGINWYTAKTGAALYKYQAAKERLARWQAVRPFLQIGACRYSSALVCEMIEAYRTLLDLGASSDREHLEYLKGLLSQGPRPYDPAQSGVISFSYSTAMAVLKLADYLL